MTTLVEAPAPVVAGGTLARGLGFAARWLEVYSQAAVSIARVGTVIGVAVAILAVAGNVFTRNVLGYSLFGAEELARFAFLWAIWLGVSLAVKRGAVTVITFVADAGPAWWTARGADLLGDEPGDPARLRLLSARPSSRPAPARSSGASPAPAHDRWFYPVVSMTVGYYFITLHYLAGGRCGGPRG